MGATQCWWQIVTCLNMNLLLLLLLLLPLSQGWLHQSLRLQTARLFIDPSEQLENDTLGPRAKTFQCTLIKRVGQAIIVTKKQLWLSFPNEEQTNTQAGCLHQGWVNLAVGDAWVGLLAWAWAARSSGRCGRLVTDNYSTVLTIGQTHNWLDTQL